MADLHRAAAGDWYRTQRIDDAITLIDEPFIHPDFRCNIWHIRGRDRDLLIDSGMGVVSLREEVPLVTEKPLTAVASHIHFDHIGCQHEFEDRCVHRLEADILANPTRQSTLADQYVSDSIFTALPPAPYRSDTYSIKPAPTSRLLEDGDVMDLGNRRFEVLHCPGHSPGGIMLYERASEILFAADIVYDGDLIDDAYHSDVEAYIATMKRIIDLPVRIVHAGHYHSFDGARYRSLIRTYLNAKGA